MPGLAKLPAHLLDDCTRGAASGGHPERPEQVRQQAAEQEANHHVRAVEREIELNALEVRMLGARTDEVAQILVVRGEQHQRAEAGRADGVGLGNRLCGVAHCVERVGGFAHGFWQARHLGNAARIVGDRPERIERNNHAGKRQHRGDRNGNAEQSACA